MADRLWVVPAGLAAGAITGVAARAWMRLITTEPEFTWSGTISIVVVFAVAGLTQGLALAVRGRWRWWPQLPVRLLAAFGALLLGGGAGIVMLPAIVAGALAAGRHDWPRALRSVLAAVALIDALAVLVLLAGEPLGWWRITVGWLAMVALYTVIIGGVSANLRPVAGGPALRTRSTAILAGVAASVAAAFVGVSMIGV